MALTASFALGACSSDSNSDTAASTATTGSGTDTSTKPSTTAASAGWENVVAPSECMCGDGTPYSFFVKRADPTKVVFFLEGGGACWTKETCAPGGPYKTSVVLPPTGGGIFDSTDARNPVAGWSIVYVPYCTGDVHLGNATTDYGGGVVMQHKGEVNASAALAAMAATFPDATDLLVAGESAGSIPSPLFAGLASDLLPQTRISVLADGSGAFPDDVPAFSDAFAGPWGTTENAIPDWPENQGMTADDWSFPDLFVQAGKHAPDIVFARHDFAFDETQIFFAEMVSVPTDDLVTLIDQNEAHIETSGVTLHSYISPGSEHTILHVPKFYTQEVNGVLLADWVRMLIDGEPMTDVHCQTCT